MSLESYKSWNQEKWIGFIGKEGQAGQGQLAHELIDRSYVWLEDEHEFLAQSSEFHDTLVKVGIFGTDQNFNAIPLVAIRGAAEKVMNQPLTRIRYIGAKEAQVVEIEEVYLRTKEGVARLSKDSASPSWKIAKNDTGAFIHESYEAAKQASSAPLYAEPALFKKLANIPRAQATAEFLHEDLPKAAPNEFTHMPLNFSLIELALEYADFPEPKKASVAE